MSGRPDPAALLEALIFAAPEPVDESRLAEMADGVAPAEVPGIVEGLNAAYEATGRAFRILRRGGGYSFATLPEYGPWVRRLVLGSGRARLSRAALETLSVIAYRQPIAKADIEAIRGVDVAGVLKLLLERRLVKIQGRGRGPGKPLLYATTTEFLRYFGINSLDDLPKPDEIFSPRVVPSDNPLFPTEWGMEADRQTKPTEPANDASDQ